MSSSMMALLATAGYVVFAVGIRSGQKVRRCSRMVACAERALSSMARDIRAAVAHEDVRLVALDAQYEGLDADTVDFIVASARRGQREPGSGSRSEIGYHIDNDPDTEAEWLARRQDSTLDDDPLEGGTLSLVGPFVSELNLEFFDGLEWMSGWEDQERFPLAVRICIVVVDADQKELPLRFETTVTILNAAEDEDEERSRS